MDKLIVIDGLDGSGKATQTALLADYLSGKGKHITKITFPDYESRSSELVKMYLSGEISENPSAINAYAAASFYAADRYISYLTGWSKKYCSDTLILCDRYVSSNAIHQMVKLDQSEWDGFIDWLYDYEHNKLGLPKADKVIYLDMHPDVSQNLLHARYGGDDSKKDIHEKNVSYLLRCREAALYAAQKLSWIIVACSDNHHPYSIQEIAEQIRMTVVGN